MLKAIVTDNMAVADYLRKQYAFLHDAAVVSNVDDVLKSATLLVLAYNLRLGNELIEGENKKFLFELAQNGRSVYVLSSLEPSNIFDIWGEKDCMDAGLFLTNIKSNGTGGRQVFPDLVRRFFSAYGMIED